MLSGLRVRSVTTTSAEGELINFGSTSNVISNVASYGFDSESELTSNK